jgi:cytochrome c-type biogenesis protein
MEIPEVELLVAFTGGLISFLSPCVLPVVPSYLTFITGMSLDELTADGAARKDARRAIVVHGTLFVAGFTAVNVVMGASASFLGSLFIYSSGWLERIGGGLLIVFGLYLLGVIRIPMADREWRVHLADKPLGFLGTAVVGVTFGAAWTPCNGPVLGPIMMLAGASESVREGVGLLLVYSMGLGVPFLAAAVFLQDFVGRMGRIGPWLPWVSRVSGVLLLIVGLLMITGSFTALSAILGGYTPSFIQERL